MAKFITGKELETAVYDIIWEAAETLIIVSPYIKLDEYFKKLFDKHVNNPKLHIIVVFGKNEGKVARSLSKADFDFFKKFLNISIVYVPNLHAKYYGNETKGLVTSINLYDYSFKNNIEFGIFSEVNILNKITTTTDQEAWNTCKQIADENEAVFIKRPLYEKKMLSVLLGKNYIKSEVIHDVTDKFYLAWKRNEQSNQVKKLPDFPLELELGSTNNLRPEREAEKQKPAIGYCIRTGQKIPFNPKRPLSEFAYRSWVMFANPDYPEAYCHKTGSQSYGKTSVGNPIL